MTAQRNTYRIKKASYKVLGMLIGLLIGLAAENLPLGIVLGLSFAMGLERHDV